MSASSAGHAPQIAARVDLIARLRVAENEGRWAEARRLRRVLGGHWAANDPKEVVSRG